MSSKSVNENEAGAIIGALSSSDPENNALSFSIPAGTVTDAGNGSWSLSSDSDHGLFEIDSSNNLKFKSSVSADAESKSSYEVQVYVSDGSTATLEDFTVSINDINDAPTVANAISDQTIAEDSALSFQFASDVFVDVDAGDSLTYTAALSNDAALPSWLSFDALARTFSGTPANADVGSVDVKVTATDGSAASVSDTFALAVTNTNDAPTGNVAFSGNLVQWQTLISSITLADDDGIGAFSFQWVSDGNDITSATNASYTLTREEVDKSISLYVTYLDAFGTQESVSSITSQSISGTTPHSLGKSPSAVSSQPTIVSADFVSSSSI